MPPSERQFARAYVGNAPRFYGGGPPRGANLTQLILQRGQDQADAALRSGQLWGNTVRDIGAQVGGALQQHQEEKKLKARDAKWLAVMNDEATWSNPKAAYKASMDIWGPDKGPEMFKGLVGVQQLMHPQPDPEADGKAITYMVDSMGHMSPEARAAAWPKVVGLMKGGKYAKEASVIPDQYSEEAWQPLAAQFGTKKPQRSTKVVGKTLVDDQTGESLYTAPEEAKPPGTHVVEGALVDDSGRVIYKAPPKPREPKDEPIVPIMGPDGNPVYATRRDALGKRPASNREQGRPVISGDANRVADMDTALKDISVLGDQITGSGATGATAKMGAMLPNVVTELTGIGADAKSKQATIDRVKQVIGKTLEGGVLRKEDEAKYEKILPTIGDPPSVVRAKLEGLDAAIRDKRQNLLDSLGDAGYDVGRFQARSGGGGAPKPGTRKTINGQTVEWDGQGWFVVQ